MVAESEYDIGFHLRQQYYQFQGCQIQKKLEMLAILKRWAKTHARFGFSYPKLQYKRILADVTIQKVLFLKFTEVPKNEFPLFLTNSGLQIWQPCKNICSHVKTDFSLKFCIKNWSRIDGFRHLSVFLIMKKFQNKKVVDKCRFFAILPTKMANKYLEKDWSDFQFLFFWKMCRIKF